MANLVIYSDFAAYREISVNVDSAKRIDPYVVEAQELDLRPFLGDVFYQEILSSPSTYATLLDGGTYAYGDYNYTFKGLKAALVYLSYARFVNNDDVKSTPAGLKRKITNESEFLSEKTLARIVANAREIAAAYLDQCKTFLCRNSTTAIYTNYGGHDKQNSKSVIITAV